MEKETENFDSQNEEQENLDSENEEQVEESEKEFEEESTEEPEYTDNERQLYARAKKAEEELKKLRENKKEDKKETKKQSNNGDLSSMDIIALSKADIADEDIDEVLDYAKWKKISVKEALSSPILKSTIAERKEERTSAQAVNMGSGRRANSAAVSDERLLADAQKGIMPEKESDIARLARLRFANK